MRLTSDEIAVLKNKTQSISKEAKLYLFGSRVDDKKRGGDIDLLIIPQKMSKKDLREVRVDFFNHFGEQKLDLLLDDGRLQEPFVGHIFKGAVLL